MDIDGRLVIGDTVVLADVYLDDNPQFDQQVENLCRDADGDAVSIRKLVCRIGFFALLEAFDDKRSYQKGQEIFVAATDIAAVAVETELLYILRSVGQFGTEKANQPRELQPQEQQRQSGKATIDGIILAHPDLSANVNELEELESTTRNRPGYQSIGYFHLRI